MRLLLLRAMGCLRLQILVSLGAIALPFLASPVALAQNQSDVTGPNLSDVTGPNLSDNTGVLGGSLIGVTAAVALSNFFDEFGNELDVDSRDSLAEQLRQAQQSCSEGSPGIRRFAREPASDAGLSPSPACAELNRLIQSARRGTALAQPDYSAPISQPDEENRRIW